MSAIDDYLQAVPADQRKELERVRRLVTNALPEHEDSIGYGMPVIRYQGKYLLGFAPFKDHLSIFPGAETIEAYEDQLKNYKTSKGTIQFTLEQPLPDSLLLNIVQQRMHEIDNA